MGPDDTFRARRDRFAGREVDLLGNGPTVAEWTPSGRRVATVNAGMPVVAAAGARADLYWVQDERFLTRKAGDLIPHLGLIDFLAANDHVIDLIPSGCRQRLPVRMLGVSDWSNDPRLGVNHGYTVIYGALQLLNWCDVTAVHLWGVGLRYFSTNTRYNQGKRGLDVDLHRSGEQVILMTRAIERLRARGIAVTVHGESALHDAVLLPSTGWPPD